MEQKFVVLKVEDVHKHCSPVSRSRLQASILEVIDGRVAEGKKAENKYLVINTDEPYAEEVIEILKKNGHWG